MKIFFDNCTSPVFANTLDGFLRHTEHSAHHISELPCGRDATDEKWMQMLAQDGDVWLVMTGDGRIHHSKVLREAYRRARLRGFVLASAYQKTPVHQMASTIVWRWPEMEQLIGRFQGPALFVLPANRSAKFSSLSV